MARYPVATGQFELLARVVAQALAAPGAYPLPTHVAALTSLGPWLKKHLKRPCDAVTRWLAACTEQLHSLTAHEPVAPGDFRRERRTCPASVRTATNSGGSYGTRSNGCTGSACGKTAVSTSNTLSAGTGATWTA